MLHPHDIARVTLVAQGPQIAARHPFQPFISDTATNSILLEATPGDEVADRPSRVLEDPRIALITPQLRQLCSEAEYKLEAHWADKNVRQTTHKAVHERLQDFTYYSNYVDLVRMELQALHSVAPHGALAKFAVLGSGPLPLTSLYILDALRHEQYGPACIHNIDHDPLAIAQSSTLCHALGHTEKTICFRCTDAQADTLELCHFDVVYLAALTGISCEQKHNVIASVVKRMKPGALLVLRTAHSLRGLLYPVIKVSEDLCSIGLKPLLVVHPYNYVINSVIICRVEQRQLSGTNLVPERAKRKF